MIKYFKIFMLLCITAGASAQSPHQLFDEAKLAYEKSDYKQTISYLQRCETALGSTNPKIESLRTLAHYADNNVKEAYISINKYFQLADGRYNQTTAHKELADLRSSITTRMKEEDEKYKRNLQQTRMQEAEKEIRQSETAFSGKKESLKSESEKVLFDIYNRSDDPAHLEEYLRIHGSSGRGRSIKNRADYLKLVTAGDKNFARESYEAAVDQYKKAYTIYKPDSLRERLAIATEEMDFQKAIKTNNLKDFEYYYKTYPKGRHIQHISNSLLRYHLKEVEQANRGKDFIKSKDELKLAADYLGTVGPGNRKAFYDTQLASAKAMEGQKNFIQRNEFFFNLVRTYYQDYYGYAGNSASSIKNHISKLDRQYRRIFGYGNNYFVLGLRADENAWIGLDMVGLKHRALGFGISARANPFMFENTITLENETQNVSNKIRGNYVTSYANLIFTKKVLHPIWLYAGGGIASYSRIEEVGTIEEPQKAMVTKNIILPNAEGGIYIALKPIVLSAGISMPVILEKNKALLNINEPVFVPHVSLGVAF